MFTLLLVAGLLFLFFFMIYLYHHAANIRDLRRFPPLAKPVPTPGGSMHLYSVGKGPTVVLLPGWSCGSPSTEMAPLQDALKARYTVIITEPLGYGWSDEPNRPRTIENMLEELRAGLKAIGAKPPYFIAGHSIAGILMTYYAKEHPEEVSGLAYLDAHSPSFYLAHREPGDEKFPAFALIAHLGILRLLSALPKSQAQHAKMRNDYQAYSVAQTEQMKAFGSRIAFRPGVMDEYRRVEENSKAAGSVIPSSVPAMFLTSSQFMALFNQQMPKEESAFIQDNNAQWRVISGGHYLHAFCPEKLAALISEFITTGTLPDEKEE